MQTSNRRAILTASLLLPFASGLAFVLLLGVNVVYSDAWDIVPLFTALDARQLGFTDLFEPHNEHRMLFPKLLMLVLGLLSNYNSVVEMLFIQAMLFIAVLAIFRKYKETIGFNSLRFVLLFLPIPWLLFSFRQYQNFLWGFQLAFVLPLVFGILAFVCLDISAAAFGESNARRASKYLTFAIASATIASFSSFMGLFVWFAGAVQLVLRWGTAPGKRRYSGLWIVCAVLEWSLYFTHLKTHSLNLKSFLVEYNNCALYIMTILGNALFTGSFAPVVGLLMLAIFFFIVVYRIRSKVIPQDAFWWALAVFSMLTMVSICLGRFQFGLRSASFSRYATYSIPFVVATYVLMIHMARTTQRTWHNVALAVFALFLVSSIAYWSIVGIKKGIYTRNYRIELVNTLLTQATQTDDKLSVIYPSPNELRKRIDTLKRLRLSIFAHEATVITNTP